MNSLFFISVNSKGTPCVNKCKSYSGLIQHFIKYVNTNFKHKFLTMCWCFIGSKVTFFVLISNPLFQSFFLNHAIHHWRLIHHILLILDYKHLDLAFCLLKKLFWTITDDRKSEQTWITKKKPSKNKSVIIIMKNMHFILLLHVHLLTNVLQNVREKFQGQTI